MPDKKFRVAEIFGPTIQGEGRHAGVPCTFIRFGGCDLRCTWCDTPHAVLPNQVAQLPQKTVWDIIADLNDLPSSTDWVVISGGNPALLDLGELVHLLHVRSQKVMVETQGTIWRDWLRDVDDLCVSPKPPSSGNTVTAFQLRSFMSHVPQQQGYLKVVVFGGDDYKYAVDVHQDMPEYEFFISVGNWDPELPTVGNPSPEKTWKKGSELSSTRDIIGHSYRELAEKVAADSRMQDVRVMPQLHVVAWGNERGR